MHVVVIVALFSSSSTITLQLVRLLDRILLETKVMGKMPLECAHLNSRQLFGGGGGGAEAGELILESYMEKGIRVFSYKLISHAQYLIIFFLSFSLFHYQSFSSLLSAG